MKRTKPSGAPGGSSSDDDIMRNMSYTNLAAMASEFENSPYRTEHVLFGGSSSSGTGASSSQASGAGATPEALFSKAMDLIRKGLKLDLNSPMQACELYQEGADLLSQALEAGQSTRRRRTKCSGRSTWSASACASSRET